MAVDWTRIAVKLQNEARQLLEEGDARGAVARYREAARALPSDRKPALDALIHYGLAEALAEAGEIAGARRSLARSLRRNIEIGNGEGVDAGRRLRARIALARRGRRPSLAERLRLVLVLELAVRSGQHWVRAQGRRPRMLIHVWRQPLQPAWARGMWPSGRPRRFLFVTDRLTEIGAGDRHGLEGLPRLHLHYRAGGRGARSVTAEIIEELGPRDVVAHVARLERRGATWQVTDKSRMGA